MANSKNVANLKYVANSKMSQTLKNVIDFKECPWFRKNVRDLEKMFQMSKLPICPKLPNHQIQQMFTKIPMYFTSPSVIDWHTPIVNIDEITKNAKLDNIANITQITDIVKITEIDKISNITKIANGLKGWE